ncbi:MAG: tetratricopeptide repeat protein [Christensenellales bacterium]
MDMDQFYSELDQLYAAGEHRKVEEYLKRVIDRSISCCGGSDPLNIAVHNELGSYYRGISKYEQSTEAFRMAGEMIARHMGKSSVEYATLLSNLGGTYRLMKKNEEALSAFLESMQIYQNFDMTDQYMYAAVLNNIALLHQELGEYDTAIGYLTKALGIIKNKPWYTHDVATTYSNLAIMHLYKGDKAAAEECLQKSTKLFQSLEGSQQIHYAAAFNNLASYHYYAKEYDKAAQYYDQASALTEKFFGRNAEYAASCKNAAYAYEKQNDFYTASDRMASAEAVYEQLFGLNNSETVNVRNEKNRLQSIGEQKK